MGLATLRLVFRTIAAGYPEICEYSQMARATMGMSFVAKSMELFSCRPRKQVLSRITPPFEFITPRNELHPKSYWTP